MGSGSPDHRKGRKVAVMIQHQMELYPAFRSVEFGPRKQLQAQRDDGAVDGEELVFKTKLLGRRGKVRLALVQGLVKQIAKEFPGPFRIGKRPGNVGPKGKEVAIPSEIRSTVQWVRTPPDQS